MGYQKYIEKMKIWCGDEHKVKRGFVNLLFLVLSFIGVFFLLSMPICLVITPSQLLEVNAVNALKGNPDGDPYVQAYLLIEILALIYIIFLGIYGIISVIKGLLSLNKEEKLEGKCKKSVIGITVGILLYTIFTWLFSPINVLNGGESIGDIDFFPLIYILIICFAYAIYIGIMNSYRKNNIIDSVFDDNQKEKYIDKQKNIIKKRKELLLFTIISYVLSAIAILTKIIEVNYTLKYGTIGDVKINGWDMIFDAGDLTLSSQRLMAFIIFAMFLIVSAMSFISVISFTSRAKEFYKISTGSIIISGFACLLVGLFGQYYKIVQSINAEIIQGLLESYIGEQSTNVLEYTVKSNSLWFFIIYLALISVFFIRNPYTLVLKLENELEREEAAKVPQELKISDTSKKAIGSNEITNGAPSSFIGDACPAFTELDLKNTDFTRELELKKQALFEDPTLPKLVDFIVQYARDSRLHLYYTHEDIATFIAGLGTTKLSILQGMSGTGKTSLPKIVAEALYSVCDIVEVESSWRDKNELLGYYNEFNKIYTPKKFTQALYKAKLNSEVLTFIVLDEMNLSRIEYYFSDFLSLMENEPDKREIKLVNVKLKGYINDQEHEYLGLVDGHTLKIPENVWFVGTANRDESTYDISDKVYDRAYTMNFDKRASKVQSFSEPHHPKYLSPKELNRLFEEAKQAINFNIESYPIISQVEKLLAPYNISFGNRISLQIETFVKIYSSCFNASPTIINDALEIILLSKVVRKLELKNIDEKETLAEEFANLNLMRCSKFITDLKED